MPLRSPTFASRTWPSALALVASGVALATSPSPRPTSQPTTQGTERAFKGWELYAWTDGGVWRFSLLVGTNRNKSDDEIADPKCRLPDVDAVKERLAKLAPGEWVSLSPRRAGRDLPPDDVKRRLKAFCSEHGLHWQ